MKMMNKLVTLLLLAVNVNAAWILRVGIDENATIESAEYVSTITQWLGTLPDPELDGAARIRIGDEVLHYADMTDKPAICVICENGGGHWSPYYMQVDIPSQYSPDTTPDTMVYYDLVVWDYDADDWSTVAYATAKATLGELNASDCLYERFDMNSSNPLMWKPSVYTVAGQTIPEPSTGALFLLGTALLFTRKHKQS